MPGPVRLFFLRAVGFSFPGPLGGRPSRGKAGVSARRARHRGAMLRAVARMTVFLLVALSLLAGIHFYLWVRLVRDTQLAPPTRGWITAAIVGLAMLVPLTLLLFRRL